MLIKYYTPTRHKTFNIEPKQNNPHPITETYKNLKYQTTSLSIFDNLHNKDILTLISEQQQAIKKEADILLKYSKLSKSSYDSTIDQYNKFFYYQTYFFKIADINEYLTRQLNQQQTVINTLSNQPNIINNHKTISISRQAIRDLTGYSPYVTPKRSTETFFIKWQNDLLEDPAHTIIVNGSRQIGKSTTIAEWGIEQSFIPNSDSLVGAFTFKTTNIIRDNMLRYIKGFPEGYFIHNKGEQYIQNTESGTKIYFRTLGDGAKNVLGLTLHNIMVDEAHLIETQVFEEVLEPTMLTTGGRLILIGTPGYKRKGYFFDLMMSLRRHPKPGFSLYEIDITKNPLVPPEQRERIMLRKNEPAIRRQYFCDWTEGEDNLFNIQKATQFPTLTTDGYIILASDPARFKDRSGYSLTYINNGKATIILSGFIPDTYKKSWELQALFLKGIIEKYKDFNKSKNPHLLFVIDVSGVGDGVSNIFQQQGITINAKIKYTTGNTQTTNGIEHKVSKSILINNTLDFITEDLLEIIEITNTDLLEEISFIYPGDVNAQGLTTMKSNFFDDITNTILTALYIIKKKQLIPRTQINDDNSTYQQSSGLKHIDSIERINTQQSRTPSRNW